MKKQGNQKKNVYIITIIIITIILITIIIIIIIIIRINKQGLEGQGASPEMNRKGFFEAFYDEGP